MKPLSLRERRLVAVAIALGLVALVWLAVLNPLLGGFTERAERREQLALQYAQNERLIARIGALRRAAEQQRSAAAGYALAAPNAEEGGELLKARLGNSLSAAGGELRSGEAVEAPAGWARASVSGVMSYPQLVTWLERLSLERPAVVVESLTIGADRAINSNRLDLLDVKVEVSIPLAASQPR